MHSASDATDLGRWCIILLREHKHPAEAVKPTTHQDRVCLDQRPKRTPLGDASCNIKLGRTDTLESAQDQHADDGKTSIHSRNTSRSVAEAHCIARAEANTASSTTLRGSKHCLVVARRERRHCPPTKWSQSQTKPHPIQKERVATQTPRTTKVLKKKAAQRVTVLFSHKVATK